MDLPWFQVVWEISTLKFHWVSQFLATNLNNCYLFKSVLKATIFNLLFGSMQPVCFTPPPHRLWTTVNNCNYFIKPLPETPRLTFYFFFSGGIRFCKGSYTLAKPQSSGMKFTILQTNKLKQACVCVLATINDKYDG